MHDSAIAPVSLDFELAYDEYLEGSAAIQRHVIAKITRTASERLWQLAMALLAALVMIDALIGGAEWDKFGSPMPVNVLLIHVSVPVITLACVSYTNRWVRTVYVRSGKRIWITLAPWVQVCVVLLTIGAFTFLAVTAAQQQRTGRVEFGSFATFYPHSIWIFWVFLYSLAAARSSSRQQRRAWELQPFLRLPITAIISADGVSFKNRGCTRGYNWSGFVRVLETKRLLLLCPSELLFETIPKRAFATDADCAAAKQLLSANVQSPESLPKGFDVIAVDASTTSPGADPRGTRETEDRL